MKAVSQIVNTDHLLNGGEILHQDPNRIGRAWPKNPNRPPSRARSEKAASAGRA